MDIFEGPRQIDGVTVPHFNKIKTLIGIWTAQTTILRRAGILDQAITVARAAGHIIEPARTQVYLDLNPPHMPDGGEVPDDLAAFNGLLLAGVARDGDKPLRYPVPVPIGMYFEPDEAAGSAIPAQLMAGPLKRPQAALYPFHADDGQIVHDLALEVDVIRNLCGLPLMPDLRVLDDTLQQLVYQRPLSR